MIARFKSPTITRAIRVRCSLFILTSCERTCCGRSSSYAEDSQTSTPASKRQNLHHAADPLRGGAQATENWPEQAKHSFLCSGRVVANSFPYKEIVQSTMGRKSLRGV